MAPKPRRETQDVPDSLPKRDEGTDVIPDKVRRTDPSQTILPDSLPPTDDQPVEQADGGVAQHPIHDDDLEDRDPEDFERWLDCYAVEAEITSLMVAPAEGTFVWHAVSPAVNRVANDGPELIHPLSAEDIAASEVLADAQPKKARSNAPKLSHFRF